MCNFFREEIGLEGRQAPSTKDSQKICFSRSFPDDVLSLIFEFTDLKQYLNPHCDESYGKLCADVSIRLSHTSRQFRAVALRLPTLWTVLPTYSHPNQISAFIRRSKNDAGLTIIIGRGHPESNWKTFIRQVVPVHHRWEGLIIPDDIVYDEYFLEPLLSRLRHKHGNIVLPMLQRLCICSHLEPLKLSVGDNHEDLVPFFSNWSMPSLSHFSAQFFGDKGYIAGHNGIGPLVSLELSIYADGDWAKELLKFLAACPTLTKLSLAFYPPVECLEDDPDGTVTCPLPNLTHLDVQVHPSNDFSTYFPDSQDSMRLNQTTLRCFIQCLLLPNLSEFSAGYLAVYTGDNKGWLDAIFSLREESMQKITKFSLKVSRCGECSHKVYMSDFLTQLPQLKHLSVDSACSRLQFPTCYESIAFSESPDPDKPEQIGKDLTRLRRSRKRRNTPSPRRDNFPPLQTCTFSICEPANDYNLWQFLGGLHSESKKDNCPLELVTIDYHKYHGKNLEEDHFDFLQVDPDTRFVWKSSTLYDTL